MDDSTIVKLLLLQAEQDRRFNALPPDVDLYWLKVELLEVVMDALGIAVDEDQHVDEDGNLIYDEEHFSRDWLIDPWYDGGVEFTPEGVREYIKFIREQFASVVAERAKKGMRPLQFPTGA